MSVPLTFYLVDDAGEPLNARYQTAVTQLRRAFVSRFPKLSDPAEISNAVEETARRVARYEMEHGEVRNLRPFFVRAYSNLVNSIIRSGYYAHHEAPTSDAELESLARRGRDEVEQKVETVVFIKQALGKLDERKRKVIILNAVGFTSKEIATRVGISEQNVNTCLHRARVKARKGLELRSRSQWSGDRGLC